MIADALRAEIEVFAKRSRENPLFKMAEAGDVDRVCMTAYLSNIHHLISHTPICLGRALDRAQELGDKRLAAHFASKRAEEVGHEVWAERDIASLSKTVDGPVAMTAVAPGMQALVSFLLETIDEDPSLYLAYILFAEHFTVVMGPEWLRVLEERCNIPRSSVTVVAHHVELDKGHVEEALDCIDDLVAEPRKLPRMRDVLLTSMNLFGCFCSELAETYGKSASNSDGSQPYEHRAVHVPAA